MREYALYKGEEILSIGTISEIAKEMGVKKDTIAYYRTQAYRNKLNRRVNRNSRILILIDDEVE